MKILLVANVVDHGTRSITESYARELNPARTIEIPLGVKQLGFRAWRDLGFGLRKAARDADVVICLHHGALFLGSIFMPRSRKLRRVAITDWTRAFPSRRRDLYIRCYNRVYALLVRVFDAIYSPAPGLRQCYESMIDMRPTLYPLPYPEVTPDKWPDHRKDGVSILYIGANIKRKAGDVLLEMWKSDRPAGCDLSFVSPAQPECAIDGVSFLTNINANTPEQRALLETHSIFLLPTRHDAYGFAALEALNFGQVVVTTTAAGIASLVAEAGGLVGESPEEAVRMAFELAANPTELATRRKRCRDFMLGYTTRVRKHLDEILGI